MSLHIKLVHEVAGILHSLLAALLLVSLLIELNRTVGLASNLEEINTCVTLAIQSEIDFKTLSLSLGHATVAFTLDTYGHVSNHMSQNAAAKMEKFIGTL